EHEQEKGDLVGVGEKRQDGEDEDCRRENRRHDQPIHFLRTPMRPVGWTRSTAMSTTYATISAIWAVMYQAASDAARPSRSAPTSPPTKLPRPPREMAANVFRTD